MGRLFDNPWTVIILIVVVVLLFGATKLPALARNLGQSMRIFKSEVKQMKDDGKTDSTASKAEDSPVEGRIVDRSRTGEEQHPTHHAPTETGSSTQRKSPDDTP